MLATSINDSRENSGKELGSLLSGSAGFSILSTGSFAASLSPNRSPSYEGNDKQTNIKDCAYYNPGGGDPSPVI